MNRSLTCLPKRGASRLPRGGRRRRTEGADSRPAVGRERGGSRRARTSVTRSGPSASNSETTRSATQGDRLSLGQAVAADVRKLTEAPVDDPAGLLALYRGPFLDGLSLTEAPDFELWLTAARESYAQAFLRRAGEVLAALTERGAWAEIVEFARGALDRDPTHEGINRSLMDALAQLGERAEALRQYETLKATLQSELGVEPSPETLALRDRLTRDDAPAAGPRRAARASRAQRRADRARNGVRRPRGGTGGARRGAGPRSARGKPGWRCSPASWASASRGCGASGRAPCRLTAGRSRPAASRQRAACRLRPWSSCSAATRACRTCFTARRRFRWRGWRRSRGCCRSCEPSHRTCLAPPRCRPKRSGAGSSRHSSRCCWRWMPTRCVIFVDDVALGRPRDPRLAVVPRPPDARSRCCWSWPTAPKRRRRPSFTRSPGWGREGILRRFPLARLAPDETAALIRGLSVTPALAHQLQAHSAGNPYFLLELSRSRAGRGARGRAAGARRSRRSRASTG